MVGILWRLLQGLGISLDIREAIAMMLGSTLCSFCLPYAMPSSILSWFNEQPIPSQIFLAIAIVSAFFLILAHVYQWLRPSSRLEIQFDVGKDGCILDGVIGGVESSEAKERGVWVFNHDKKQEVRNVKVQIMDMKPKPPGMNFPFECYLANRGLAMRNIEANDKSIVKIVRYTNTPAKEKMSFFNNNGLEYSVPVSSYLLTLCVMAGWRLMDTKKFVVGFERDQFLFREGDHE